MIYNLFHGTRSELLKSHYGYSNKMHELKLKTENNTGQVCIYADPGYGYVVLGRWGRFDLLLRLLFFACDGSSSIEFSEPEG